METRLGWGYPRQYINRPRQWFRNFPYNMQPTNMQFSSLNDSVMLSIIFAERLQGNWWFPGQRRPRFSAICSISEYADATRRRFNEHQRM